MRRADAATFVERVVAEAGLSSETVAAAARRQGLAVHGDTAVAAVASLRRHDPAALDTLARRLTRPQCAAAAAQGFATSVGGLATLPLRLSADAAFGLWFTVRATSGAMGAFGFPVETPQGQALLRAGLLATADATDRADPLGAAARHVTVDPAGVRLAASSARQLVRRVAGHTGRGQLGRAAPLVGGVVGATVNASAVHLLTRRARLHFRALLTQWQVAVDAGDLDALERWSGVTGEPPTRALPG